MIQYKEIHWDGVITEFAEKDGKLFIHFRAGKKMKKLKEIDQVLDKHVEKNFFLKVAPTGAFIEEQLEKLDLSSQYAPKDEERVQFPKGKSLFSKKGLPQERPEEFKKTQELYRELMKLYDNPEVIHKSWASKLNSRSLENESWDYIIHYKSPFIDELMLKMCSEINQELIDRGLI